MNQLNVNLGKAVDMGEPIYQILSFNKVDTLPTVIPDLCGTSWISL